MCAKVIRQKIHMPVQTELEGGSNHDAAANDWPNVRVLSNTILWDEDIPPLPTIYLPTYLPTYLPSVYQVPSRHPEIRLWRFSWCVLLGKTRELRIGIL